MLDADIRLRLERLNLDAVLSVQAGEVVALRGPNGAGKSTVLRALSGLLRLDGGKVELAGTVLEEPAKHIRVAPEKRPVGLMFQEYLLFPHLSAVENVAFGLRARGGGRRGAWERLGVHRVTEARPGNMSGGQQQRVAMARAMVPEPKLLLLDEPLAALDVSTKTDVRRQLRATLRESQAANVMVTHDLLDAVALADRMFVIEDGGIAQSGTPAEVTARPKSRYVADLGGVTLLRGTGTGRRRPPRDRPGDVGAGPRAHRPPRRLGKPRPPRRRILAKRLARPDRRRRPDGRPGPRPRGRHPRPHRPGNPRRRRRPQPGCWRPALGLDAAIVHPLLPPVTAAPRDPRDGRPREPRPPAMAAPRPAPRPPPRLPVSVTVQQTYWS